jgi:hypothetical protein
MSMRMTGKWPHPLPMPQFDVACADGRFVDLDDLRGRVLRIVAESEEEAAAPASPAGTELTTIMLARTRNAGSDATTCTATEPETWIAFAILSGVPSEALVGEQVLVDQNGWLRVAWRPGDAEDWTDPDVVAARIRAIVAHPLAIDSSAMHAHHH